jgi:hypothetical protein
LCTCFNNETLRERLGKTALLNSAKFSSKTMAQRYCELYDAAIS